MFTSILLTAAIAAPAQCGCSGGFAAAPLALGQGQTVYNWVQRSADDWQLFSGPYLQGGYRPSLGQYFSYAGGQWTKSACPAELPAAARAAVQSDAWRTNGVQLDKISSVERSTVNGHEVRTDQLLATIGAGVPDDSRVPRLSILGGSEQQRRQVLGDLDRHSALAPYKGQLGVIPFPADHWAVTTQGFRAVGDRVTLYLQEPAGRVVWRSDGYPGPDELAKGLRRIRPDYHPENDPGMGSLPGNLPIELIALGVVGLGAVFLFVLTNPKRK